MAHLKRNINLVLLIICILCIGYVLTLTTYYESNFGEVSSKYYEQVDNYENLIEDIKEREQKLNETSFELTRKTQDKEKLNELYTDVVDEKTLLQNQLTSTKTSLATKTSQLKTSETSLATKTTQLNDLRSSIGNLDPIIEELMDDIKDDSNLSNSEIEELFDDLNDEVNSLN